MGTDMTGWVEIQPYHASVHPMPRDIRYGVIKTSHIVDRDYDMFGCLFGITNHANFSPVVGVRGLPDNLSREAQEDFRIFPGFAQTWITWPEIAAIDWEEMAEAVDERPHAYVRGEDGVLVRHHKAMPMPVDREAGYALNQEGMTWEREGFVYRMERLRRRDAHDRSWQLLFDLMARLAEQYGGEHVRLVASFDR